MPLPFFLRGGSGHPDLIKTRVVVHITICLKVEAAKRNLFHKVVVPFLFLQRWGWPSKPLPGIAEVMVPSLLSLKMAVATRIYV